MRTVIGSRTGQRALSLLALPALALSALACGGCSQSERTAQAAPQEDAANPPAPAPLADAPSEEAPSPATSQPVVRTVSHSAKEERAVALAEREDDAAKSNSAKAPRVAKSTPRKPLRKIKGHYDVTFDTIKFDMKKNEDFQRSMITQDVKTLVGQKMRIRGYILPGFKQKGITSFVLVRDNMECCFGPGAMLYDCIIVDMVDGASTEFSVRPVTVEGVFSLKDLKDPFEEDTLLGIYHLQGEKVE